MTTLGNILSIGASGVETAQTALSTVSNNVANVNTPGYVQTAVNQTALSAGAQGAGVSVADIQRITNQYLQGAAYAANASSSAAAAVSDPVQQAQSLFGDPTTTGSLFSNLDSLFSGFSALAATPTAAAASSAVNQTTLFFNQASEIASSLSSLSSSADQQISTDVGTVNQLLGQISQLNATISRSASAGQDITGAQNQQGQLLTQLSSLMDVKVTSTPLGGVTVLASSGATLVGSAGAASLAYDASGPTGDFTLTNAQGVAESFNGPITSGQIGGLAKLRNASLPAMSAQLATLVQGVATALNTVHNAHSASPPPTTLTGADTGLDLPTIAGDFTGKTTIALVNKSTGVLDHTVTVDFTARTISVDGGGGAAFTTAGFGAALNTALGGVGGGASFANGALTLTGNATDGVAVQDDATTPATDGGLGFSAFFGLNNLVSTTGVSNFNTGLKATDASGFAAGQTLTLRLTDANGAKLQDVTVTTPGGTVASLVAALNAPGAGVGAYGAFSLSATGALSFTPTTAGVGVSVVNDATGNAATGASVSQLFGIGAAAQASVTSSYAVRSDIAANGGLLASAALNLSAGAGVPALTSGDTSGADALGQAGLTKLTFPTVAGVAGTATTVSTYASTIAGVVANAASNASTAKTNTAAVASSANTALSSVEGVNIDQEMIALTTYQQAYNASARMIQAANNLFTTLLTMTTASG